MGSEDADLEELGHIYLGGEKLEWDTKQTGAVGRMTYQEGWISCFTGSKASFQSNLSEGT